MNNKKIRFLTIAGVFCAVIFVFTAYLHFPTHTGYTHVGDGFIYLVASLLPLPYAIFAGACGAFLADFLTGYAIWAPGSVIIKAVTVLFFTSKGKKILHMRNYLALIPAALLVVLGFYLYEGLITGNFIAPLAGVPGNIVQAVLSSILYVVLGTVMDKIKVKDMILK